MKGEEVVEGIERWLKARRDEYPRHEHGSEAASYYAIDKLLDELRDDAVEGWLPWEKAL